MKRVIMVLVATILIAPLAAADSWFEVRNQHDTLWSVWDTPVYRQAFPDWAVFKAQCAEMSGIVDTDLAWRSIQKDFTVFCPSLPGIETEEDLRASNNMLMSENDRLKTQLETAQEVEVPPVLAATPEPSQVGVSGGWVWAFAITLTLLLVMTATALLYRYSSKEAKKATEALKVNLKDFQRAYETTAGQNMSLRETLKEERAVMNRQLYHFDLPSDMSTLEGSSTTFFRLVDGKVPLIGNDDRMSLVEKKNLKGSLYKLNNKAMSKNGLKFNGAKPEGAIIHPIRKEA